MSAMPENIVPFQLPKKPKVRQKIAPPDQRTLAVVPIRAIADKELGDATFRALALLCSYCNRAGITWVSQKKMAEVSSMSQQAISKHIAKLTKLGYVEVVRKGFRGERANTWRVIFDQSVDADTAIAITNPIEDTRPPTMRDDKPDPEGQRKIASLIAKALKPTVTKKEYTMPKGKPTRTVQEMQNSIAKAKSKRTQKAVDNPATFTTSEVVHEEASHTQPKEPPYTTSYTTSEVVQNTENTVLDKDIYKPYVLHNQKRIELREAGLSDDEIDCNLEILLAAYQAEGLTPNPDRLATEIADLAKVGRGIA